MHWYKYVLLMQLHMIRLSHLNTIFNKLYMETTETQRVSITKLRIRSLRGFNVACDMKIPG